MNALNDNDIRVLHEALDDEYHAWATYDQVISDFGEVAPFIHIRDAEGRHIEALLSLFRQFALPVPDNTWPGRVERYPSLLAACEAGVAAEIANAEMYDRLLAAVGRPEILEVLRRLQEASQQRHLPAFERCVERCVERGGAGGGPGRGGAGPGRRWRGGRA
ncbi:ferritin-like domain-containing protein [Thauera phenolivorans]|uniref:ferritin-like domain-containing protein n=1 Tax=Thauera phenolivorans TaxID=1792543 RepID=UPI00083B33D7|nr:DUF2202 domain-containing protein [Thauera phenolivorans]